MLAALLLFKRLLVLLAGVAELGLARAMRWLGSDSFSAIDSAPPVIAIAAQAVQQSQPRLNWLNFQLLRHRSGGIAISYSSVTSLKAVKIMSASDY